MRIDDSNVAMGRAADGSAFGGTPEGRWTIAWPLHIDRADEGFHDSCAAHGVFLGGMAGSARHQANRMARAP
jgi:hypothetical protein